MSTIPALATPSPERIRGLPLFEPVRAENENGERMYVTPDGYAPSVTTVLSGSRDNSGIELWRESIGEARADEIVATAIHRGIEQHSNLENYLLHGIEPTLTLLTRRYWVSTEDFLKRIVTVLAMEGAVWHPEKFAGAFDCIAYLDDDTHQPSLLDWKTADKPRNPTKMYEYSLQVAAYVAAANHVYRAQGLDIQRAMIVVALPCQDPQIKELDRDTLDQLFRHFLARLKRYTFARK